MSHKTVQQIVVRMLYDPEFANSVYADSANTLKVEQITEEQRNWLTTSDRRAWGTDPLRRTRSLHALVEEYPVSATLAAKIVGGLPLLDNFFSSARFHDSVRKGDYLVTAFAAWLRDVAQNTDNLWSRSLTATATIEEAMATVRRAQMPPITHSDGAKFRLSPLAALVDVYCGALQLIGSIRTTMGTDEAVFNCLVSNQICLDGISPVYPDDTQHVLVMRTAPKSGNITLEELSPELAVLLHIAKSPTTTDILASTVIEMGAGPQDALEILEGFLEDQLLVPCG
ncbi:MAG: hypothetical protein HUU55_16135 [Myxococcales bacterium]|nr:hypothetical protein [Myxococcales bacterium]